MASTCGQGHCSRLINVLSAYTNPEDEENYITLNIGYKKQIRANATIWAHPGAFMV